MQSPWNINRNARPCITGHRRHRCVRSDTKLKRAPWNVKYDGPLRSRSVSVRTSGYLIVDDARAVREMLVVNLTAPDSAPHDFMCPRLLGGAATAIFIRAPRLPSVLWRRIRARFTLSSPRLITATRRSCRTVLCAADAESLGSPPASVISTGIPSWDGGTMCSVSRDRARGGIPIQVVVVGERKSPPKSPCAYNRVVDASAKRTQIAPTGLANRECWSDGVVRVWWSLCACCGEDKHLPVAYEVITINARSSG